jgi:hypothetical protein
VYTTQPEAKELNPPVADEGARFQAVASLFPHREHAEKFIEALTGNKNSPVTFQTFPEGGPSDPGAQILHGTLEQRWNELVSLNQSGHGVFVMVNEGDGNGRSAKNVIALRSLFTDDDGKREGPAPSTDAAPPTILVQSARGGHTYWVLKPGESLSEFTQAQVALASHFGTDPAVKDLPRVMRVPGFFHLKDRKNPFLVTVEHVRPARHTIQEVLAAFPGGTPPANGGTGKAKSQKKRDHVPREVVPPNAVVTSIAVRRARAYLSKVPGAVQGENGDTATYQVACMLVRDFGLPFDEALSVFLDWNKTCSPPWPEDALTGKLQHAEQYATGEHGNKVKAEPGEFQGTEDLCFVVPLGRYFLRLPNGQWDLASPLTKDAAKKHLRSLGLSAGDIKSAINFDLMPLAHGMDCSPGHPSFFMRDGRYLVNNYKPPRIVPEPGEYPRIKTIIQAITDNDPGAYAWLWNWMAAKYQNPGARNMTAPVFQGAQGIGKTKLGLILAALLGEENTACISQADLDSPFNGHFVGKLFVIADEVVNQENLKDTASVLKKYITDPRIMANIKNVPQYEMTNRMSWWFTSNSITPVKVEGSNDRRYSVFASFKPPSAEFKTMMESIHKPDGAFTPEFEREMAAFAHALLHHPVDHALAGRPHLNAAREALISATRNSAELFLAEVTEWGLDTVMAEHHAQASGNWSGQRWDFGEDGVLIDALYTAYIRYCETSGAKPFKKEGLGQHVRQVFPSAERGRISLDGKRPWVYRGLPRTGRQ